MDVTVSGSLVSSADTFPSRSQSPLSQAYPTPTKTPLGRALLSQEGGLRPLSRFLL